MYSEYMYTKVFIYYSYFIW